MPPVLLRQYRLVGGDAPVDGEVGVVPGDGSLGLRGVEAVALVLEDHLVAQHAEPVGEAPRDEELTVVVFRQLHGHVLSVGRRAFPDVHRHVQHGALYHAYQFCLREGRLLEMQAAYHSVARLALVVLDEVHVRYLFLELSFGERLEEVPPVVLEDARLDDHRAVYRCLDYFHVCPFDTARRVAWRARIPLFPPWSQSFASGLLPASENGRLFVHVRRALQLVYGYFNISSRKCAFPRGRQGCRGFSLGTGTVPSESCPVALQLRRRISVELQPQI